MTAIRQSKLRPLIYRTRGLYMCGVCEHTFRTSAEASQCLGRCIPSACHNASITAEVSNLKERYKCTLCFRTYLSRGDAQGCLTRCVQKLSPNAVIQNEADFKPRRKVLPLETRKRQGMTLIPSQEFEFASERQTETAITARLTEIEEPAEFSQDAAPQITVQKEVLVCEIPVVHVLQDAPSTPLPALIFEDLHEEEDQFKEN